MQADILDGGPNNGQATVLGGKHINLIGALPDKAPETFNGVRALNMVLHDRRKGVKRQGLLFLFRPGFSQPRDNACHIWRFSAANWTRVSSQLALSPDDHQFGGNLRPLTSRDSVENIALLMQ